MSFSPYSHLDVDNQYSNKTIGRAMTSQGSYYCLCMFPYPSGDLHIGHVRNYTIGDVIARYKRLQGYDVLHPMGWDAFGLPAENAAIAHKLHPAHWTRSNIERMKKQMDELSLSYDWDKELATIDPSYYAQQQKLFLKMVERGAVYRKKSVVNWDPVDETVLANEQVIDGKGWRSGAQVEQKEIDQWYLKITDYADRLVDDLDELTQWPDKVVQMQKNWIGRSRGCRIQFSIPGQSDVEVFTTRPDTVYGVSALVVAYDHPLAKQAAKDDASLQAYLQECAQTGNAEEDLAQREKTGRKLPFHAIHPLTGDSIPVWVGNYVLMGYGTGAVMSVPAHDERDYEFAKSYHLPITQVIENDEELPILGKGKLIHSGEFSGLSSQVAATEITKALSALNKGGEQVNYRLRDWGISRQRYWGCPIPMVHCEDCGVVPEKPENLPVTLPIDIDFGDGKNVLSRLEAFKNTPCPVCQKPAQRETDTFDTFFDSSWYFNRFASVDSSDILDERVDQWLPVDLYIGGIEHAILHLLYARFINKVLFDLDYVKNKEPFKQLLTQGMVLKDGVKMSKSKGNVVRPSDLLEKFGVDATRLFICFAAPPEQSIEWSDSGVGGAHRFLSKLWKVVHENQETMAQVCSLDQAQKHPGGMQILMQIQQDFQKIQLNTVVSGIMKLLNWITQQPSACQGWFMGQLLMNLYPLAPNLATSLLTTLNLQDKLQLVSIENSWCEQDEVCIVVQIRGKKRAELSIDKNMDEAGVTECAMQNETVKKYLDGENIRKVIYVKNRLLNIVI